MFDKRVTLFCGHYGSGKTNVALNAAIGIKQKHANVAIADLDIVNPYFRTKDSEDMLKEAGIRLICSEYASSNVDIPALPQDMYAITDDRSLRAVLDIGGDDRGALVLGRLAPQILAENNYDMFAVVNMYRPLTSTVKDTVEVLAEIEQAGGIAFNGIINNSNLGALTTVRDVVNSFSYAEELSRVTGLEVVAHSVMAPLAEKVKEFAGNVFALQLQKNCIEKL